MTEKVDQFMQSNEGVRSMPRRLLFYSMPFLSLLACAVAVAISYLAGSALLLPFTHNPIMIGSLVGSLLCFLFTGIAFAVFTYVVVVTEKSQSNLISDHFRHTILLYVLLISITVKEYVTLPQAFLPIVDVNNDALIASIYTAQRTLTVLEIFIVVIVSNLVVLYFSKKRGKKTE